MEGCKFIDQAERELVESIRARRPVCPGCGKRLKPKYKCEWERAEGGLKWFGHRRVIGVHWFGYNPDGVFCTLGCAYRFALRVVREGWKKP